MIENSRIPKQQTSSNGNLPADAVLKIHVEKKGFKRAEAAIYLGVAKITIDRLTKRGLLHPSRALRHPIYSKDDLDRFLRETTRPDSIQRHRRQRKWVCGINRD